jgi:arginyl-tRNA synthetase
VPTTKISIDLSSALSEVIKDLTDLSVVAEIDRPASSEHGDYSSNVAMIVFPQLSSEQKATYTSPRQLAERVADAVIQKLPASIIAKTDVAGPGFINFSLSVQYLGEYIDCLLAKDKNVFLTKYLSSSAPTEDTAERIAIVEYSSPNIAKPFTIGHLRSTIIGQAVANLLEATGWKVFRDNHLGDWGTQFGKQIYAFLNIPLDPTGKKSNEEILDSSDEPVKLLVQLYVDFHKQAEENPALEDEARTWFKRLEDGDEEARRIWQKCINWSFKEFDQIYQRLGVSFTENDGRGYGESFFEDKMGPVLKQLEEKKLLKESEGAKLVFLEEEKLPPFMVVKKDGATLYATRDLATDKFRKENIERYGTSPIVINEVGIEQAEYFRQLFAVEYRLGWYKPGQRIHVKHGHFRFQDKKMSTRKGNVIWLADVLDEAVKRANGSEEIGIGALKWNDLKRSAHLDVVFNWDEMLSMEGNSGPYMQYTYARCQSVLRKVDQETAAEMSTQEDLSQEQYPVEVSLMRTLSQYPEVLLRAASEYAPHHLCTYLFGLAQEFNSFYHQLPILKAEKETEKELRLQLTKAVSTSLENGLHLLGIQTVERM